MDKYKKICIYCRGTYGVLTYLELKNYNIKVDFFGDKDKDKQGYVIDGVFCKSYEEILLEDKDIFLIVAKENPNLLIEEFRNLGFRHVLSSDEALKELLSGKQVDVKPITDGKQLIKMKDSFYNGLYLNNDTSDDYEIKNIIKEYRIRRDENN